MKRKSVNSSDGSSVLKKVKGAKKIRLPFSSDDHVLVVGDGNLSFSAALERACSGIKVVATVYDSKEVLEEKYPDAAENVEFIEDCDGVVLYKIDATKLHSYGKRFRKIQDKDGKFDTIVFNFPHTGRGIKDQDRNIRDNQLMLRGFFSSCHQFDDQVRVIVTLATSKPYSLWGLSRLAAQEGFKVRECIPFDGSIYPGYEHRRTIGFDKHVALASSWTGETRRANMWVFEQ